MTCPICYEDLFQKGVAFFGGSCGHSYHVKCLNASVLAGNQSCCPTCRRNWETDAVVVRSLPVPAPVNELQRIAALQASTARNEGPDEAWAAFKVTWRRTCSALAALEAFNVAGAVACMCRAAPAHRFALAISMIYVVDNVIMAYERSARNEGTVHDRMRPSILSKNNVLSLVSKTAVDVAGAAFIWVEKDVFVRAVMLHATRATSLVVYYAWAELGVKDKRTAYLIATMAAVLPMLWATWTNNLALATCAAAMIGLVEAEKAIWKRNVPPRVMYAIFLAHVCSMVVLVFSYVASTLRHM
jgi:hypothetical protein